VGSTVQAVIENRWRVYTGCEVCELRMVADLPRIALAQGFGSTSPRTPLGSPKSYLIVANVDGSRDFMPIWRDTPPFRNGMN
jgi:hypothetical protein